MRKLRLFFMMAFTLLVTGWAYAQENEAGNGTNDGGNTIFVPGQEVVIDLPTNDVDDDEDEPTFPISIEIGNGQDNPNTGISQNAKAYWAANMGGDNFFDTPRYLQFSYQLLTDAGDEDGDIITKEKQLLHLAGEPALVEKQFVMDPLVPNRLYRVRVWVEGDNDEVYESGWYFFISAIPDLVSGKLVWNWLDEVHAEDQEDLFGDDLAEDNGGTLRWDFSDFDMNESGFDEDGEIVYVHVDGVTGYVELYQNGTKVRTLTGSTEVTGSVDMVPTTTYELKSYATYKYRPGTIVESENAPFGVCVERGDEVETDPFASESRGPQTWKGTDINPNNIHVGQFPFVFPTLFNPNPVQPEQTETFVVLDHLPASTPLECMGMLRYKEEGSTEWQTVIAELSLNSHVARWVVPTTKNFDFTIQLTAAVPQGNTLVPYYFAMPEGTTAHVTQGGAKTFDLADRHLLWNDGEPSFVIPLEEDEVEAAQTADFTLAFKVKGGQRSHTVDGAVTEVGEDADSHVVLFDFSRVNSSIAENKAFDYMSVTVKGESYLKELKKEWKFFTAEGAKLAADLTGVAGYRQCDDIVSSGDVIALDPRNGDAPLMDVTDATKPAPLYFYDWAWTPKTAPVIKDIQIEHNDVVTFTTTNETRDVDTELTYKSQVQYTLPTKYNNAQAIGSLTVYDFVKQADMKAMKDWVNKAEGVVPSADVVVVNEENGYNADWGKTLYAKGYEYYGPYTLYTVAEGEVPEGKTTWDHNCFTMAPRTGKINNGSEGVPGFEEVLDSPLPEIEQTTTLVNGVLSVVPNFIIWNIYNWNYLKDEEGNTMFAGECGQCDYTIYAWLETPSGEIASHGTTVFNETSATGSINELGQVVFNSKLYFVDVDYDTDYKLKGYMLYTPQRYTLLQPKNSCTPLKDPEIGPVVKVGFEYPFHTSPEIPTEAPENSNVKYYIAEEDFDGNTGEFVEVRIYDPDEKAGKVGDTDENTQLKLICQLIPNNDMPAVDGIEGQWVSATDTEEGYYKFIFPVDNDPSTDDPRDTYSYGFAYYYQQGELETEAKWALGDKGINTPDPYLFFVMHKPATVDVTATGYTGEDEIGPWELEDYCATLTNFFAFTEEELPTAFENWDEYWGNDEKAKNLVYEYEPSEPTAPGRRGLKELAIKGAGYAPIVRLDDKTSFYFNDEFFDAGDAKYTGTFLNKDRTVMVPFKAVTEAEVRTLVGCYLNEDGDKVFFRFSRNRNAQGQIDDSLTPNDPFLVKPAAAGDVEFTGEDVLIYPSDFVNSADAWLQAPGYSMEMHMKGVYEKTLASTIFTADNAWDDNSSLYFRYSQDASTFLKMHKTQEYKGGVMPFECYLKFVTDAAYFTGSIGFRFDDDDDATMIENINVETQSSDLFDVMGRKVTEPVKGQIYIQNGKKILF